MLFDRGRVVAERLGYDRHGRELGELVHGAQPGSAGASSAQTFLMRH
jgi:hypothetical protein